MFHRLHTHIGYLILIIDSPCIATMVAVSLLVLSFLSQTLLPPISGTDLCDNVSFPERDKNPICWCKKLSSDEVRKLVPECDGLASSTQSPEPTLDENDVQLRIEMCPRDEDSDCSKLDNVRSDKEDLLTNPRLFQGDIAGINLLALTEPGGRAKTDPVKGEKRLWINGEVPYKISSGIKRAGTDGFYQNKILEAMEYLHNKTCVRYRPATDDDENYVVFFSGFGCTSYWGKQGGRQGIQLQIPGCFKQPGVLYHAMMHTLGFMHEQARADRDSYVEINQVNVLDANRRQFASFHADAVPTYGLPYDFDSVTHYAPHDFAVDQNLWTIRSKPKYQKQGTKIGQRDHLSALDIQKVNILYQCPAYKSCGSSPFWISYSSHCYYFSFIAGEAKKSRWDAVHFCEAANAQLASRTQVQKLLVQERFSARLAAADKMWTDYVFEMQGDGSTASRSDTRTKNHFVCEMRHLT